MALSGVRQEHLYLCVQEMHKEGYAVTEICDILALNRSSYYNWTHRVKRSREEENEALLHEIGLIYAEHNGTYGYRRIADEYNETHEKKYNLKRFYRLGTALLFHSYRPALLDGEALRSVHAGNAFRSPVMRMKRPVLSASKARLWDAQAPHGRRKTKCVMRFPARIRRGRRFATVR